MNYSVDIIDALDNEVKESRKFETLAEAENDYDYFKDILLEEGDTIQLWNKTNGEYEKLQEFESIDRDYQIAFIEANFKECEKGIYDIRFQKSVRKFWEQTDDTTSNYQEKEIELLWASWNGVSVELTQTGDDSQNFPLSELTDISLKELAERTIGVEAMKLETELY